MAPKRSAAAVAGAAAEADPPAKKAKGKAKAKPQVKQEQLCVANKSGKELANAVQYKLKHSPGWVRKYYEGRVKYNKSASPEEKKEFLSNLLACSDFTGEFFTRIQSDLHEEYELQQSEWISWKQVLEKEDTQVALLMLKSGKLKTRPHRDLNMEDEEVQKLPDELKLQYCYVRDIEADKQTHKTEWNTGDDNLPPEDQAGPVNSEDSEAQQKKQRLTEIRQKMQACRSQWSRVEPDLDLRVTLYMKNEYMGKAGEEANKQLQKLRKDQKKLVKDIGVIFESEEFDEEQLAQWESFVTEVNSGIKSLKEKLQGMQQFVKKMSGGSSSSTA